MAQSVDIRQLNAQLESIYDNARSLEAHYAEDLAAVHTDFRDGALNLVHYLALRQADIRDPPGEPGSSGPVVPRQYRTRCYGLDSGRPLSFGNNVVWN